MRRYIGIHLLIPTIFYHVCLTSAALEYYGRYIGPLKSYHHGVTGDVYAVDARTFHIRDFTYDGEGPAAYFYVGNTKSVNANGFRVLDEKGSPNALKRYRRKHITLTLPEGRTLNNIKWFSVWCDEAAISFADIKVPKNLDFPKPQKISPLSGVHAVSSDPIVVVDAQTLLIPSFSYDGEAPDAKFWVGRGTKPSPQGIRVPDENGKELPLRRYDRKTIVLTLPGDLTIFDIGHFGVWCEAFTVDFGHIQIPRGLNVPPSLKMLGVSPQSKLNCEVLHEELAYEVRWALAGDSIVVQLVAKLEDGEYMSFGLSGDDRRNMMIGADVVVAWVDHSTLNGYAVDYYLDDKSQCAGTRGSCPDYRIQDNTNSVRLLNAALVNGYSIVTYQRPVRAHDALDKPVYTNTSQAVVWAVGPLNSKQEVSYHSLTVKGDLLLNFGRTPRWNCPIPESDAAVGASNDEEEEIEAPAHSSQSGSVDQYKTPPPPAAAPKHSGAWDIPPIQCNEPEDGVFYAQMGPTGGSRGYSAITKHVGWGIAFYINGLLIPEIHVVRGKTYTFVVEGGLDPEIPAKFHPFYITDDPVGGYEHKTPEERAKVKIFAGVERTKRGEIVPTGTGRLCNWTPDPEQPPADEFASFGAYQRTLTLVCDHGEPGVITWTPDEDTPDVVYYQCFSHRYLGWKIHVHDTCDLPHIPAASATVESRVKYEQGSADDQDEELESRPSIRVTTRVRPDGQLILGGYNAQNIEITTKSKDIPAKYNQNFFVTPVGTQGINNQTFSTTESLPNQKLTVINSQYVNNNNKVKIPADTTRSVIPVSEEVREGIASTLSDEKLNHYENIQITTPQINKDIKNASESKPVVVKHKVPAVTGMHRNNMAHGSMPNGRPMIRRPISSMSIIRPQFRRPPQHAVMMGPHMQRPMAILSSATQNRPIIVKKPIYRIPIGAMARPVMINSAYHPQPSVIVPPHMPVNHPHVTKSVSVSYSASKGKGKPIPVAFVKPERFENRKENLHPSKLISHITEESKPNIPLAVNTGFNPGSLVIEGGFKPIIQNIAAAQDRISEVEDGYDDNTEGTVRLYAEDDNQSEGLLSQQTQMFEPMFIPSPPDSVHKHVKKPTGYELEANLQKKKNYYNRKPIRQSMIIIRRRPVTASFRSQQDDTQDETAMAAERMDTYYLPPSGPVYGLSQNGGQVEVSVNNDDGAPTIVTYDGKTVSDSDLVPPVPSSQAQQFGNYKSKGSSDLLKNTPQFGPYRGEIPPPVPEDVKPENIPQLRLRSNNPPPHSLTLELRPGPESSPISRTRLSYVRPVEEIEDKDELISEESEIKETQIPFKSKQKVSSDWEKQKEIPKKFIFHTAHNSNSTTNKKEETEAGKVITDAAPVVERDEKSLRRKRSAHHEPGHVDHDMHGHDHHEHEMKHMQNTSIPTNSAVTHTSNVLLSVVISSFILLKHV